MKQIFIIIINVSLSGFKDKVPPIRNYSHIEFVLQGSWTSIFSNVHFMLRPQSHGHLSVGKAALARKGMYRYSLIRRQAVLIHVYWDIAATWT